MFNIYNTSSVKKTKKSKFFKQQNSELSAEDLEIVTILEKLKIDLDILYNNLNYVTEPLLIDSYIYEINAVFMRYSYYLNLCKEHNLVADE